MSAMTKGEREDLQRLIRQREKVQKSAAKLRSNELLADFENQMAAVYKFDDDEVWAAATKAAEAEVAKAQELVAARCAELGIPKDFAPGLALGWRHRGYNNAVKERRDELRKAARARITALEQKAIVAIEMASVTAATEIAVAGLTSEAARGFVERLPTVEALMPTLSYQELSGEAETPLVEQLLKPNALREQGTLDGPKALPARAEDSE